MRRHREKDVEIACGRAAQPSLALAGQPDAGAVLDALRDVHLQRLFTMHPPGALEGATGLVDHLAADVTGGTGALDGEEALLGAHAAATVAGLAADRVGTALGAAGAAGLAGRRAGRAEPRGLAQAGVFQRM